MDIKSTNYRYVKMAVLPYCLPPIETGPQCRAITEKYNTLFPPRAIDQPWVCPDMYPVTVTAQDVITPPNYDDILIM
jgi:hypothetical protein